MTVPNEVIDPGVATLESPSGGEVLLVRAGRDNDYLPLERREVIVSLFNEDGDAARMSVPARVFVEWLADAADITYTVGTGQEPGDDSDILVKELVEENGARAIVAKVLDLLPDAVARRGLIEGLYELETGRPIPGADSWPPSEAAYQAGRPIYLGDHVTGEQSRDQFGDATTAPQDPNWEFFGEPQHGETRYVSLDEISVDDLVRELVPLVKPVVASAIERTFESLLTFVDEVEKSSTASAAS